MTDRNRPGGVLAFDPQGGWVDFVAPVTAADRLWSGAPPDAPEGPTTDDLEDWLARRRGRQVAWLGSSPAEAQLDSGLAEELRFGLSGVRRRKDAGELAHVATQVGDIPLRIVRESPTGRPG